MKTRMRNGSVISCLLACLVFFADAAIASLTATIDKATVSKLDVITLTLRSVDPSVSGEPDLRPLSKDFQVLDTSKNSRQSISIVNGRKIIEAYTDWNISLTPKREGRLIIPSLTLGSDKSNPIYINVAAPSASAKQRSSQLLFFETEVDTNETYVQAQILYTVKLFYSDSISGDFPQAPKVKDAIVEIVDEEKRYQSIVNHRRYYVLEKRYAIFPQKSGTLEIPRETFMGYRGSGGFFQLSSRERVNAISESHSVKILPKPAAFPSTEWLPATSLSVSESWSTNPPLFQVGEPLNRTITISASGLPASSLPDITETHLNALKIYKDPAETSETAAPYGIVSTKKETIGLVPTQAGMLTLPEIRIPWWNTRTDQLEMAVIPSKTYVIQKSAQPDLPPIANAPENLTASQADGEFPGATENTSISSIWFYITLLLLLICLFTINQLLRTRRQLKALKYQRQYQPLTATASINRSTESEEALYKKIVRACHDNDPKKVEDALFVWAKQLAPEIETLSQFANRQKNEELSKQLENLERHLYGNNHEQNGRHPFIGSEFLDLIARIRSQMQIRMRTEKFQEDKLLAELNPTS